MKLRVEPLDAADLGRLSRALGRSESVLKWMSRNPDGVGTAITAWQGDTPVAGVIAQPSQSSHNGTITPLTRLVLARVDHPEGALALADRLSMELDRSAVLSLSARLSEPIDHGLGTSAVMESPIWATGPDPFVPTQPDVEEFEPSFSALSDALASSEERRIHRTPQAWAWQYQEHPEHTYRLMHIRRHGRVQGFIAARIARVNQKRTIVVQELSASDEDTTYMLLKSVRRWSWEERSLPVVLVGAGLQRWFAFTAGYVALPSGASARRRCVRATQTGTPWTLHEADWCRG